MVDCLGAQRPIFETVRAQIDRCSAPLTGSTESIRHMAVRMGARFEELDGLGHWWMLDDPARGAAILDEFWASLG